jgi:hypothetical protein
MPFCPVCEDEFRPGFTFCRRCNAELVPELADPVPPERATDGVGHIDPIEEVDWVELHVGVPGAKFDLVRSLLVGAGVRVHVQTVGSARWHTVGAMGAITGVPTDFNAARILVSADDQDTALSILQAAEEGSLALNDEGDYPRWSESHDDRESALPEGLEVVWSLSHVADEINRLCALLEEQGLTVSVAEMDVVFPWARWREMSAALSFPNDTRNVRLLVAAERVEEAQRIIEEATGDLPFDEDSDEAEYETDDELDHADWPNDEPEIGDMGGPPLADR